MRRAQGLHWLVVLLVGLAGGFVGNTIGKALAHSVPLLAVAASVGFAPFALQVADVFSFNLGLMFHFNVAGFIVAILAITLVVKRG